MSTVRKAKHGWLFTLFFSLLSIVYVMPIIIVLMNSFKKKIFISNRPFSLPDAKSFVGLENYASGMQKIDFLHSFAYSLFITVGISGIWCRPCSIYVLRFREVYSTGNRRICHD